jgi:predicted metal-dependent phosphoesterase TrpH
MKVDLHVHTFHSMDASTTFEQLLARCNELGLGAIAIADHGTAKGALEFQKIAPFQVIVAEEVLTPYGEIMGMFLKETIPSGTSVENTIAAIKEQGGLVCIPHPFDPLRSSALESKVVEALAEKGQIDILEVLNARILLESAVRRADKFAKKYSLLRSAGSDAHRPDELGNAFLEMPPFHTKEEFLESLKTAEICGRRNSPLVHFHSTAQRLKKKLKKV